MKKLLSFKAAGLSPEAYRHPMPVAEIRRLKSGTEYPLCPRCRISLDREYQHFCDRCGQALDWRYISNAMIIS